MTINKLENKTKSMQSTGLLSPCTEIPVHLTMRSQGIPVRPLPLSFDECEPFLNCRT